MHFGGFTDPNLECYSRKPERRTLTCYTFYYTSVKCDRWDDGEHHWQQTV